MNVFGATNQDVTANPFGGQASRPTTGFGQPTIGQELSLFGTIRPPTSVFGTTTASFPSNLSAFGQVQPSSSGSALVKYQPLPSTDAVSKNGQTTSVKTLLNCISAMKEYEGKCMEELRTEHYAANGMMSPKTTCRCSASSEFGQQQSVFGENLSSSSQPFYFGTARPVGQNSRGTAAGQSGTNAFGRSTSSEIGQQPSALGHSSTNALSVFGQPVFVQHPPSFGSTQTPTGRFGWTQASSSNAYAAFGHPTNRQQSPQFGDSQLSVGWPGRTAGAPTFDIAALALGQTRPDSSNFARVKYRPLLGVDIATKNRIKTQMHTIHHCITALKEYEAKSIEEWRLEHYTISGFIAAPGTDIFGQSSAASKFGGSASGVIGHLQSAFGQGSINFQQPANPSNQPILPEQRTGLLGQMPTGFQFILMVLLIVSIVLHMRQVMYHDPNQLALTVVEEMFGKMNMQLN